GMSICEDLWITGGPAAQLGHGGAELIININGSPFRSDKIAVRDEVLLARAVEAGCPIVYVNLVGGQDELIFDGASTVVDRTGAVVARAHQFAEDLLIVDLNVDSRPTDEATLPIHPVNVVLSEASEPSPARIEPLGDALDQIHDAIVLATKDYVAKTGFSDICMGVSGGIDSSVVAAIAVEALGAQHVHGIALPSRFSSDHSVDDAERLAENLGFDYRVIAIEPAHRAVLEMLSESFVGTESGIAEENIQSRLRGVVWMALANKFGWLVLTTSNKSEAAVGYATLYGDTAGAYAVIGDLYKTTVYALARRINERAGREIIPEAVITKAPSAELRRDQRDDQSLPPYDQLDPLLEAYIEGDRTAAELIELGFDSEIVNRFCRLVDINEFKRRQTPLGPRLSSKSLGRDRRLPIVNGYRP
ncbi:MAG: NAD+ synthase, partial [Acidobacteria bacterium]|nr:NAD+ synthase [Acidobacteriota bacterium]